MKRPKAPAKETLPEFHLRRSKALMRSAAEWLRKNQLVVGFGTTTYLVNWFECEERKRAEERAPKKRQRKKVKK